MSRLSVDNAAELIAAIKSYSYDKFDKTLRQLQPAFSASAKAYNDFNHSLQTYRTADGLSLLDIAESLTDTTEAQELVDIIEYLEVDFKVPRAEAKNPILQALDPFSPSTTASLSSLEAALEKHSELINEHHDTYTPMSFALHWYASYQYRSDDHSKAVLAYLTQAIKLLLAHGATPPYLIESPHHGILAIHTPNHDVIKFNHGENAALLAVFEPEHKTNKTTPLAEKLGVAQVHARKYSYRLFSRTQSGFGAVAAAVPLTTATDDKDTKSDRPPRPLGRR
ncbi:MAG: hypothetical protein P1U40_04560 [Coxiellaceae bacterium]|nr:hypothetical protein [Coxiellaceae bacterium]